MNANFMAEIMAQFLLTLHYNNSKSICPVLKINHLDFFLTYNSQAFVIIMYSDGPSIIFHLFGVIALIGLG